ncbi:MAG: toll/interleukin-1 receptor domain-containing protein [Bryobacteraceae bacterium]
MSPDRERIANEDLRRELERLFLSPTVFDADSLCTGAEDLVVRYVLATLLEFLSDPANSRRHSSREANFVRDGQMFSIRTTGDIDDPNTIKIRISPFTNSNSHIPVAEQEFGVDSSGMYSRVELSVSDGFEGYLDTLSRIVRTAFEAGYRALEQHALRRLEAFGQDVARDLYRCLRVLFKTAIADYILLYVVAAQKGVYLHDSLSLKAALGRASQDMTQARLSPMLQVARFASIVLPSDHLFVPKQKVSELSLVNPPYAESGLNLAELTLLQSDKMIIQRLVGNQQFKIEACYPPSIRQEVEDVLRRERPMFREIMERRGDEIYEFTRRLDCSHMPVHKTRTALENGSYRNRVKISVAPRAAAAEEFDTFISYARVDSESVSKLKSALELRGLRVWMDTQEIEPGCLFQDALQTGILRANGGLVIIGTGGLTHWQSLECNALLSQFAGLGRHLIPILLPGVAEIPSDKPFLKELQYVKFTRSILETEGIDSIIKGVGVKKRRSINTLF